MRWLAVLLVCAGCGGTASAPAPAVADDAGYPAGPYGYLPGYPKHAADVLPDLLFDAKVVPTGGDAAATPLVQISMGSLRAPGTRYFVLDVAARWCSDCVADEPSMIQLEADYAGKGVLGVEVVCEGALDVAATPADLDAWSHDEGITGTLVVDHDQAFETAAAIDAFPTYFIVDASTMKIVERTTVTQLAQPLGPTLDALLAGP